MGLSLRGKRVLHSKRAAKPLADVVDTLEEQHEGQLYLSSTALINHAPEYPENIDWDHRIVAIQARILYTTAQLKSLRERRTDESWASMTEIIAQCLSKSNIIIPSLDQVEAVLLENN
jgi:hypothetical protein